jgi:hypothetical protein
VNPRMSTVARVRPGSLPCDAARFNIVTRLSKITEEEYVQPMPLEETNYCSAPKANNKLQSFRLWVRGLLVSEGQGALGHTLNPRHGTVWRTTTEQSTVPSHRPWLTVAFPARAESPYRL